MLRRPDPTLEAALLLDNPQKAATAFLNAWKRRNFDAMYTACQRTWKASQAHHNQARGVRIIAAWFGLLNLVEWSGLEPYTDPDDPTPPEVADFRVTIAYRTTEGGDVAREARVLRVIREAAPYTPGAGPGTYWGVNPASALRFVKLPAGQTDNNGKAP